MHIRNGRTSLDLHVFAQRQGPTLLLLHGLQGSSADWTDAANVWPGSVYALDFSGHGASDWLVGGGYTPELLLADADAALEHTGKAAVVGAGLGSYIALLLAGARADDVVAALLLPGAGLFGAGGNPTFEAELPRFLVDASLPNHPRQHAAADHATVGAPRAPHDPLVPILDAFVRPPYYAEGFAHAARKLLLLEDDAPRPPWWQAAMRSPAAERIRGDVAAALERLAATLKAG